MIRLIISILIILLFSVYTLIDVIVGFIIKKFFYNYYRTYYHSVIFCITNILLFITGAKVNVFKRENISIIRKLVDEGKPVFIISNHRSNFDCIIGYSLLNIPCSLVVKDNLLKVPVLSYWIKKMDCYFLNRNDIRSGVQMVIDSINKVNTGVPVWIFPEGTRNKDINPINILEFKAGAFKIASKTNAYICPLAFYKTDDIFEKHKPFIKASNVGVDIGNIFRYDTLSDNDKLIVSEYFENIVKKMLINMGKEVYD